MSDLLRDALRLRVAAALRMEASPKSLDFSFAHVLKSKQRGNCTHTFRPRASVLTQQPSASERGDAAHSERQFMRGIPVEWSEAAKIGGSL